ncbi:MAG TPA: RsmE family RNA methyltransferase [Edaphocola sp.]|nr:RsmE family RNA methyltransferase [Edaphocola sp.]
MLPFFYQDNLTHNLADFTLDELSSKHCIQVLRMEAGTNIMLTNGKGLTCEASIKSPSKKHTVVTIKSSEFIEVSQPKFSLAIAFTKNKNRNEWLLEKLTEIGVSEIYPLLTHRSERDKLNMDRLNGILVSAMLQSQQSHLPNLHKAIKFKDFLEESELMNGQKFIAHCISEKDRNDFPKALKPGEDTLILIGPEGDFSEEEIALCLQNNFQAVSFGKNRLRTETAGLYACTVFNALNNE